MGLLLMREAVILRTKEGRGYQARDHLSLLYSRFLFMLLVKNKSNFGIQIHSLVTDKRVIGQH